MFLHRQSAPCRECRAFEEELEGELGRVTMGTNFEKVIHGSKRKITDARHRMILKQGQELLAAKLAVKRSKNDLLAKCCDASGTFSKLSATRERLLRLCEFRRRQIQQINLVSSEFIADKLMHSYFRLSLEYFLMELLQVR
jgi:hypothetical protein